MTKKLHTYLDDAFADIPQTKKVIDLKDELYANMQEKYQDQLKQGKSKTDAYHTVITDLGDISELVASVQDPYPLTPLSPQDTHRRALIMASAVMLYILSPMAFVIIDEVFDQEELGVLTMFLCIALATGMIIYNAMTKPKYHKTSDTVVEDFKQWRVSNERKNYAYKAFASAYWSIVVVIYLVISFALNAWAFSWLILIIAAALENVIKGYLYLKDNNHD